MRKRLDLEGVDGTWCQPFHPLAHEYVSPLYPVSLLKGILTLNMYCLKFMQKNIKIYFKIKFKWGFFVKITALRVGILITI